MMVRYFLLALLVAVAAAADDQNTSNKAQELDSTLYESLNLTEEQTKAAKEGENKTVDLLAYMQALGLHDEKEPSCVNAFLMKYENIKFTLYSMPTHQITWSADENNKKLTPYFDPKLPTQIFIHGRTQLENIWQPVDLAFTYGIRGHKMNLITVDWSAYSGCPYVSSVFFTVPQVAIVVSKMIQETLVAKNGADYNQIRLTGFGLGAHAAAYTARKLPQSIPRITALDPAGLLYNYLPKEMKLQKTDANFVDVIMTNQGVYGLNELVGDINFLPSGGRMQKACKILAEGQNACSHELAIEYFIESVNKGLSGFIAKPADSWNDFLSQKSTTLYSEVMGESVSQKRFGNFYLDVNAQEPYSKGVVGAYVFDLKQPIQNDAQKTNSL